MADRVLESSYCPVLSCPVEKLFTLLGLCLLSLIAGSGLGFAFCWRCRREQDHAQHAFWKQLAWHVPD